MSYIHIQSPSDTAALERDLATADRIALDCEAAGFHRYSDRLCLLQLTVSDRTYVIDPLSFDPTELLRGPLEDPDVSVLMHGADFDLRLLARDLDVRLRGLVDTQVYAALVGEEALGLQSLLESRLGVKLSKKYQRADWAERPLTDGMLEYAAGDTRHLEELVARLTAELEAVGRRPWADEECRALERVADDLADDLAGDAEGADPVARVKGARELSPRQVTALRAALEWRDEIARKRDRALFRVVGDGPLVEAVARQPLRIEELLDIRGFPRGLAREEGGALLRRLDAVAELPDSELKAYPRGVRRGPGRPPPELEALVDRLKGIRNEVAKELGLPRGTVLANAVVIAIAQAAPRTREELLAIEGMREWKADVLGDRLLAGVARG
jgi:ribonuclease D